MVTRPASALAVFGLLVSAMIALPTLTPPASAQNNGNSNGETFTPVRGHRSNMAARNTKFSQDLMTLVGANEDEAATLRGELSELKGDRAAIRVWRSMIKDHLNAANMLAKMARRMGERPDLRARAGSPVQGSVADIVRQTLQAHRDTLNTVKGMEARASSRELAVLRKVEHVVENHIRMLEHLSKRRGR
jgi:hypothetical protein